MMMEDMISYLHTSCKEYDERYSETQEWPSLPEDKIPDWLKPEKRTTKGIPLSEEHKKKISESLKKKNAEKKAQQERIQKTATASQKRKAAKK